MNYFKTKQGMTIMGLLVAAAVALLVIFAARGCGDETSNEQEQTRRAERTERETSEPVDEMPEPEPEPAPEPGPEPEPGGQQPQPAPPSGGPDLFDYDSPTCDANPLLDAIGQGCPAGTSISLAVQASSNTVNVEIVLSGPGYPMDTPITMTNVGPHQPGGYDDWVVTFTPPSVIGSYSYHFVGVDASSTIATTAPGSFKVSP